MEENEDQTNGIQDVPVEEAVAQEVIPFDNDELHAAMTGTDAVYISIPGICRGLGIRNAQPQVLRIQRTRVLNKGLVRIPIKTRGGFQNTYCLRVDLVALWLAGFETSRMKVETEQQRLMQEKIERYQEELAPLALQVFMRVIGLRNAQMVPTQDPGTLAVAEQLDTIYDVASSVRDHLGDLVATQTHNTLLLEKSVYLLETLAGRQEHIETQVAKVDQRTRFLTVEHAREVRAFVDRIADTLVRRQKVSSKEAHIQTYLRLKARFQNPGSYKEIDDDRFEEVIAFLQEEQARAIHGDGAAQQRLL